MNQLRALEPKYVPLSRNYHITDFVDIDVLREMFQQLSNAAGVCTAVLDLDGKILIATNWQDICVNFHRANPETAAHCLESDTVLAGQLEAGQKYTVYRCKNGFIDIAVPIVIDDMHIGNIFTGQLLLEKPDLRYFERQALKFGFDREEYIESLLRVPVFRQEDIEKIINLLCKTSQIIGKMGLNKCRLAEAKRELVTTNAQLQEEVAKRKRFECLLRENEDKYKTLFNSSRDAIMILSPIGRFVDGNPSTLQLFGCQNKEEFIRMTPADLSPEYQPDGVLSSVKEQEMVARAMEKGSHFFEWKYRRANGEEFFASVLLTKMHLQNEAFLQATVRDVSETRLAEENLKRAKVNQRPQQNIMLHKQEDAHLRDSQQMLQLILDHIPQRVFWKDRDSVYLGCNRNFAEAAGVASPQELVGKTDYDLAWTEEETKSYRECDRRVMELDAPALHIIESQRQADGKQAWLDTNKIPLHDGAGRVVGILGTYEDITERQNAENALRESEKRLKEANRELEAFTYTVSHDFRTPLTVILGYADLLQKKMRDRTDEQELNSLSAIHDSAIRMKELMEDLLALARIGQIERPPDLFDAGEVVNDVISGLAEIITKVDVSLAVGDLPVLRLPRTLLRQVFHNLISNALRYGCKPGDAIEIGGDRKEGKVRFYVRDYGPGIPEEERDLVFKAFYRGTTGKDEKGSGIGLATVQKIARLFDGRAWVEETPGGGSTFLVEMVDVA